MILRLAILVAVLIACADGAMGQKTPPQPPDPHPPTLPPPRTLDWNPDSRMPEAMRVDGDRFKWRISVDPERLAGPENLTKSMTIAEFELFLAANRDKSDEKLADLISGITLSERASSMRRKRWERASPGALTKQALKGLTDVSSFLDLPAEDRPALPTPTLSEQRKVVGLIGAYLGQMVAKLPDFLATKQTTYFEDWPTHVDWPAVTTGPTSADDPNRWRNRPLYPAGAYKLGVAYRNGQEVQSKSSFANPSGGHLTTVGEFGPILLAVVNDAARSTLQWSGWEESEYGTLAVFRFEVPQDKSHYSVDLPTVRERDRRTVPYGGEMAVRPADGAILRLTVIARMPTDSDIQRASITVEYGTVEIGGRSYLCPVHGVALSKVPIPRVRSKGNNASAPLQTQVNDIVFDNYHVFRSDSRIESVEKPQ